MTNIEKYLNQLSNMLKKRENQAFGKDLRNELLRRANTMNAAATQPEVGKTQDTGSRWRFSMTPFWKKTFASVTAFALLLGVVVYSILPGGSGQIIQIVNIAEAQDYYTLTPTTEDTSGVNSESGFILESKGTVDAGEVQDALVITPETAVDVEQISDTSVQITPVEPLQEGEVYSVQLDAQNMESSPYKTEYSWAYQVSENLSITGTLPSNQSTQVPMDAGIEINFNYNGMKASDFANYYTIEPTTNGGWDVKDKTAVFVPADPLTESVIYTVTIKAGLPLNGSEKTLAEDYTFQFETSGESRADSSVSFASDFYNATPGADIVMQAYYYSWWYDDTATVEENPMVSLKVYAYESGDDFADALQAKQDNTVNWSYYYNSYIAPVDGLDLIIDAPETPLNKSYYDYAVVLPQTLDTGYYLVKMSKDGTEKEAFLQVSNLATYVSLSSNKSLIWVNDISTGLPISDAEVEISGVDSANTNSQGVAEFDKIFPEIETYSDSEENTKGLISVTSGDSNVYYPYDYWNNYSNNDYWQFFETERDTYHPTDKIYYWGFLKGRTDSVSGDAQLIITNNTWIWDAKYLAENDSIFYSEDIQVEDGGVFKGDVDIEKLAPGWYALEIVQDEKVISTAGFSVQDFVKPAYDITVTPEKTFLFSGESTNIDVAASFFEGTPVSNLELNAYYSNKGENTITTDDGGETSINYIAGDNKSCEVFSYCDLFSPDYISINPVNEEEASIYGEAKVTTINSLVGAQEVSVNYDENLTLQTKFVDIDKVSENTGWISSWGDVYGEVAPNTKVVVTVLKKQQVKTEIGQYYDYINKITKTEYEYSEVDVSTDTLTLYTDVDGNLDYDLGLDSEYIYNIDVAIYDANGNYYREEKYVYPTTYGYYYDSGYNYYSFDGVEEMYDEGSDVSVSVISNDPAFVSPSDGSYKYIYLQSKDGTNDYEVSDNPNYSFEFTNEMVPNMTIAGIIFDGETYSDISPSYINYNYENKRLTVEISPDKDVYEPGAEVTLNIKTSDEASVNLYLVDEAYYSLFAESVTDPLTQLYSPITDGILYRFASTEDAVQDTGGKGGCFKAGTPILMSDGSYKNIEDIEIGDKISTRENPLTNNLVSGNVVKTYEHYVGEYLLVNGTLGVTGEHIMFINGQWNLASELKLGDVLIDKDGNEVPVESIEKISEPSFVYNFEVEEYHTYFANDIYVHNDKGGTREVLKDTALFDVVDTDSSGNTSITFTLPDNITSWRVVASAINGDKLEAGLGTTNIDSTRPVIVLPVISSEYLVGDKPSIPVRAYGDYLTTDSAITFGMDSSDLGYEQTQDGSAYQNVYFDFDGLTAGKKEITTWAETDGGNEGDSLMLTTNVVSSHFAINKVWNSVLSEGIDLQGSDEERTELTFVNGEVGAFYDVLISSSYNDGDRADQMATKYVSQKLLNEYFDSEFADWEFPTFNYQSTVYYGEDGGIALLTYDSSRLELSAKLAALDSSLWSEKDLISYFESYLLTAEQLQAKGYNVVHTDYTLTEKIMAIYGLAAMDENYLTELNYLVTSNEMTLEDKIYAALAYLQFGAKNQAQDLYLDIIQNYSEVDSDYIKITEDGASLDSELSWTALAAVMAAEIGDDNIDGLWKFVIDNDVGGMSRSELVDVEKLLYAKGLLDMGADAEVSFKLNGEKITLKGNDVYTVSMLPEELSGAKFSSITGDVNVITNYEEIVDPSTLETDSSLSITRKYFVDGNETNILKAGDLVEIQLTATVPGDVEGIYSIIDYLPSGLRLSTNGGGYFHFDQGQAVSFAFGYNPFEPEDYAEWELCTDNPDGSTTCSYYSTYDEYLAAGGEAMDVSSTPYTEIITYTARVINKGVFIAEPAVIQDAQNTSVMNVSGETGSVMIE
ncbi:MAG: polymorphic toxin-type HINT domain-containing protein [Candidatus Gracilibacteria bacterium]